MSDLMSHRAQPHRSRAVPISHFRTECETARLALLSLEPSLNDEIETWRPGGSQNAGRDAYCWLAFYRRLRCEHAVRDAQARNGGRSANAATAANEDAIVVASLSNEPLRVPRAVAKGTEPSDFVVYPKSFYALTHLMSRDVALGFLARQLSALATAGSGEDVDLYARGMQELELQQAICVWIITTPGAGLPFDSAERAPTPPEWTRQLEVTEFVALIAAHQEVNRERLAYLRALIEDDPDAKQQTRPSWSVFFGVLGTELQVRPETLMRDRSLCEVLAQVRLTSSARQEAQQRAQQESEQRRKSA